MSALTHGKGWRPLKMHDLRSGRNSCCNKGTIYRNRYTRTEPSLPVGYTGNARTNHSERGRNWAALTLTAV